MKAYTKHTVGLITLVILMLTSCSPATVAAAQSNPETLISAQETNSARTPSTFTLRPTSTRVTNTPSPSMTSTPEDTPSETEPTATVSATRNPTPTPRLELDCPLIDPDFEDELPIGDDIAYMDIDALLDFLNQGGSPQTAGQIISNARQGTLQWLDLTGDDEPELVGDLYYFVVFACQGGQFHERLRVSPEDPMAPPQSDIRDLNANGIPDMVITTLLFGEQNDALSMYIYEWNGNEFGTLLPETIDHPYGNDGIAYVEDGVVHMDNGAIWLDDIDDNGTIEIQLEGGIEDIYEYTLWMWNGQVFDLVSAEQ
jgi:hypothetical protein